VGKAKNIKKRITSHFGGSKTEVAKQAFQQEIYHIDYLETGNELIALLHESYEIRKNWPRYNRAQKNNNPGYCIFIYEDRSGYKRLQIGRKQGGMKTLIRFTNHATAFHFLTTTSRKLNICPKLAGYQNSTGACFDYQVGTCEGACVGEESPETHNDKIAQFIDACDEEKRDYILIGAGRSQDEKTIVMVENGTYLGYGFFEESETVNDWEGLKNLIQRFPDNPEVYRILASDSATKGNKKVKKDKWKTEVGS
jgi:DNA polymerase-3 subunit epsilon